MRDDVDWQSCESYVEFEKYQESKHTEEDRYYWTYEILDLSDSYSESCCEVIDWYLDEDGIAKYDSFKFGNLCVYRGEDGGFPEYVRNKLIEECDLWCGHMG